MKKRSLLSVLILLFIISVVYSAPLDLSTKTNEELTNIYESVLAELLNRTIPKTSSNYSTKSEILFRNIPWGSSSKSFIEALRDSGVNGGGVSESYNSGSFEFDISDYGGIYSIYRLEGSGYEYNNYSVRDVSVGGFQVSTIGASFLYSHDDDSVDREMDDSTLYMASYTFKAIDGEATYSVLAEKLSSLYGKGVSKSASSGIWSTGGNYHAYTQYTAWYGAKDTGVVLCRVYTISDTTNTITSDKVTLTYGKTNSQMLFNELKAAMAREELKKATSNNDLSGL